MRHHYPKSRVLPLFFCAFCAWVTLFFHAPLHAETVAILPQFNEYPSPRNFPNLEFKDVNGNTHQLSEYRGNLLLVNLWATWCLPCRKEMRGLDSLQDVFAGTKLKILPISLDNPNNASKISDFFQDIKVKNLPILNDYTSEIMHELKPPGLPTSYLIGPDGRALGSVVGYANWDSPEAGNLIEAYLPK